MWFNCCVSWTGWCQSIPSIFCCRPRSLSRTGTENLCMHSKWLQMYILTQAPLQIVWLNYNNSPTPKIAQIRWNRAIWVWFPFQYKYMCSLSICICTGTSRFTETHIGSPWCSNASLVPPSDQHAACAAQKAYPLSSCGRIHQPWKIMNRPSLMKITWRLGF